MAYTGRSGFDEKLVEAARRCDGKTLETLVKESKVNLNVKDKVGCTAVHLCCKSADLASLALLLEHGARTDMFDNSGMAPIHYAAMKDYIETMAVLVSYGADVNIQNADTKETPLHVASMNRNTRSIKFLLYCGANTEKQDKSGKTADLALSKEECSHSKTVRDAFRDGHIKVFGKMINSYERCKFKSVGLTIANTSPKSKQFSLLCRKITVGNDTVDLTAKCGVMSYLKGDGELISDFYEYLVNQVVEEVWVSVPVYTKSSKFDAVYILDSTGTKFKCTEMKLVDEIEYYSACIILRAHEDSVYSFAVVTETKSEIFMVTGMGQTLTSSVENDFRIQLPEGGLPKNTEVSMKVIPTMEYQPSLNTELIKSTSHFCEIRINQKNRRALAITLPVPSGIDTSTTDDTKVAVFHSDEATQTPSDWKEVDSMWRPGSSHVIVTDKSINKGTCIVTKVPKKKGSDILNKIKEFVAWLYDTAVKRKTHVCFFAATKCCSVEMFRLLVGMSDEKMVDEHLKTLEKENYVGDYSQKTASYLVTPGKRFNVCWSSIADNAPSSSKSVLLVYQRQRLSYGDFIVPGKEHDVLQVSIRRCRNKDFVEENANGHSFTQINVELLMKKAEKIDNYSSLQFTEYPDNKFLSWLAQEIGNEWMVIGIGLGLRFSYLESIERDNNPARTNLTMLYTWRIDQNTKEDIGLPVLLNSLALAQRKDLVTKINEEVQELLTTKPAERVCRWVQKLSDQAKAMELDTGLDDIDGTLMDQQTDCKDSHSNRLCISCLTEPEQAASPFSETFLVQIVAVIGSNLQLILLLGLPQSVMHEIRQSTRDPTSAMFKCLLRAQRRYNDAVKFYEDLMEGLKTQRNMQAIREIKSKCTNWFTRNRSSMDRQMKKLEQVMNSY